MSRFRHRAYPNTTRCAEVSRTVFALRLSGCRVLACLLFTLVAITGSLEAAQPAAGAADDLAVGIKLYQSQRYDLAAQALTRFLTAQPAHPEAPTALAYLGQSYVDLKKYKEARQVLRQFVDRYPTAKTVNQARYRVAECSYFLDEFSVAVDEFATFLKEAPDDPLGEYALPYRGDALLRVNQPAEAEAVFRAALKTYPSGKLIDDTRFGLASALEAQEKVDAAIQVYDDIVTSASARSDQALLSKGLALFDKRDYQGSATVLKTLATSYPTSALKDNALLNAGFASYYARDFQDALQVLQQIDAKSEVALTAKFWQGMSQKALRDYPAATALFDQLVTTPGFDFAPQAAWQAADASMQAGNFGDARQRFETFATKYQDSAEVRTAWLRAAEAALLSAQPADGLALLGKLPAATNATEQADEAILKSRLLISSATAASATAADRARDLQQVVELTEPVTRAENVSAETKARAGYHLAHAAYLQNDFATCIQRLEPLAETVSNLPGGQDAWVLLGLSQFELNQDEAAVASATRYLQLPGNTMATAQAHALLAKANTRLNKPAETEQALTALAKTEDRLRLVETLLWVGQFAQQHDRAAEAAAAFQALLPLAEGTTAYPQAVYGWAWSQFDQGLFPAAAESFEKLAAIEGIQPSLEAEAIYTAGVSRVQAHQLDQGADLFRKGYDRFALKPPVEATPAQLELGLQAYNCAREEARARRRGGQVTASAEAYSRAYDQLLLQPAEKQTSLDKLLDEWALLHYEAEDYPRADELFRLLVKSCPDSDRSDDALLILAESLFVNGQAEAAAKAFGTLAADTRADTVVQRRALYQLASVQGQLNDWKAVQAATDDYLTRFAMADPANPGVDFADEMTFRHAEALLELGQPEAAAQKLTPLLDRERGPEVAADWLPAAWLLAGESLRQLKQYAPCRQRMETFEAKFANSPLQADAQILIGRTYIAEANFDQARKSFARALEVTAGGRTAAAAQANFYTAETHLMEKQYAQAQLDYYRVYHVYNGQPQWQSAALFQAAQCDEALGNTALAVEVYQKVVSEFPSSDFAAKAQERLQALAAGTK